MEKVIIKANKWFVEFPLFKYEDDVVSIAQENNVVVVDAKFKNDPIGNFATNKKMPELTLKKQYQQSKAGRPRKED